MKRSRVGISKSTVATPAWAKFQQQKSSSSTSALEESLAHIVQSVQLKLSNNSRRTVRALLFQIKSGIETVKEEVVNHGSTAATGLPLRSSSQQLMSMHSGPPESVAVTGSFMLNTMLQADATIDMSVIMPSACFAKGDHRQYQYHDKKILYMRQLAHQLQGLACVEKVEVDAVNHDILRPALLITPDWDGLQRSAAAGAAGESAPRGVDSSSENSQLEPIRIRVMVGHAQEVLPDSLLEPQVNNHTRRGHFGRAQVATPRYNFRIRWDSEHTEVLRALHGAIGGHAGALQAVVVLKDWARRRGLGRSSDGIGSTVLTAVVAFLAQKGIISQESPLLVCLRAAFRFLASDQCSPGKPILLAPPADSTGEGEVSASESDSELDSESDLGTARIEGEESESSDSGVEDEDEDDSEDEDEDEDEDEAKRKRRRIANGAATGHGSDSESSDEDDEDDDDEDEGDEAGPVIATAEQVRSHLKHSKIVVLSPSGRVNLAALVSTDAWEELRREASLALTGINGASLRDAAIATGCWDVVKRSSKQSVVEAAEQARRGQYEMEDGGASKTGTSSDRAARQIALAEIAAARDAREVLPPCIHTMLTTAPADALRLVFGELAAPSMRYDRVSGIMIPPSPFEVAGQIISQSKLDAPRKKKQKRSDSASRRADSAPTKIERLASDQETMLWHHVAAADADTLTDQLWPETFRERVGRVVGAGLSKWVKGMRILPAYAGRGTSADSAPSMGKESEVFSAVDALRSQAESARECGFAAPQSLRWSLDQEPPVAAGVWLCVNLDTQESTSNVIRGPSAEDKGASTRFRHIWGPKAELRRFKDGSIIECAAFPAPLRAMQGLYHRAVSHLLRLHLSVPPDGIVTPGLPLEATLERAQLPFAEAGGAHHETIGWSTSSDAAAQACSRALDRLRQSIMEIAERLSLPVASVVASDAGPRGTSRIPIAPHPLAGAGLAERAAMEPWMGPAKNVAKAMGSLLSGKAGAEDEDDDDAEDETADTAAAGVLKGSKAKKGRKSRLDQISSRVIAAARSMSGSGEDEAVQRVLLSTPMASSTVPTTDIVLRLEDSQQWPIDPTAIEATKTAFYLQIGRHLDREYGIAGRNKDKGAGHGRGILARASKDFLMVLLDGYAFRCRIHLDREVAILRRMAQPSFTGAVDARALERDASPAGLVDTSQLLALQTWTPSAALAVLEPPKVVRKTGRTYGSSGSFSAGTVTVSAGLSLREKVTEDEEGYAITPGGLPTKTKMISVEDALSKAAFLELHGYRRPRHAAQIQAFINRTPGYAGAVRLTLQWLASIGSEQALPMEAIELLVASIYTEPRPFLPPSTPAAAFLRTLRMIASFDWSGQALFVDIDSAAPLDSKVGLGKAKRRHESIFSRLAEKFSGADAAALSRMARTPLFMVTPEDVQADGTMAPYWTASSPGTGEWTRVVAAAQLSQGLLLRSWSSSMDPAVLWKAAVAAEEQSTILDPSLRMHGPKAEAIQSALETVLDESGASASVARKLLPRVERQAKMDATCEPVSAASRARCLLESSRLYKEALQAADGFASADVTKSSGSSGTSHAGVVATCMSVRAFLTTQGDEVGSNGFRPPACLLSEEDRSAGAASGAGEASDGSRLGTLLSDWGSMDAQAKSSGGFPPSCSAWQSLFRPQSHAQEGSIVLALHPGSLPRRDGFNASPPSHVPAPVLASRLAASVYRGDGFKLFECFAGTLPPESIRGLVSCAMIPATGQSGGASGSALVSEQQVVASTKAASGKVPVRAMLRFGGTVDALARAIAAGIRSTNDLAGADDIGGGDLQVVFDLHDSESVVVTDGVAVGAAERPARRLGLISKLVQLAGPVIQSATVQR